MARKRGDCVRRVRQTGITVLLLLMSAMFSACDLPFLKQDSSTDPLAEMVQQFNAQWIKEPLQYSTYAREVGASLSSPRYQRFAVNETFSLSGTVKNHRGLRSPFVWVSLRKMGDQSAAPENEFDIYIPIKKGTFVQSIRLFAGKGEYQVTVRLPSREKADTFYELTQFTVVNVNPRVKRDIAYSPYAWETGLSLTQPSQGLVRANGRIHVTGIIRQTHGRHNVMIQLVKGSQSWDRLVSVKNGAFAADIPLYYGKGIHQLRVLVPDAKRQRYYQEGAEILVDNADRSRKAPIRYFADYEKRGIQITVPQTSGGTGKYTYRIAGRIDPDAPYAGETRELIIQTVKDGEEATYFIPVKNYRFDGVFWLRFGPGRYEVSVNVPEITHQHRDYFRFFRVAQFEVNATGPKDLRYLLPSRGIQSDSPQIEALARRIVAGQTDDRAKAKAIYRYVATHVRYDVDKFRTDAFELDDSALKTLREKKGVCQDYTFLTVALLRSIGIEARFVEGMSQGNRHAWVEARIDGQWLTMDPTWGSGYLTPDGHFVAKYDPRYFDPDPAFFARTHRRTGVMY
jgi:transglutaminase-like putative cysteine protease